MAESGTRSAPKKKGGSEKGQQKKTPAKGQGRKPSSEPKVQVFDKWAGMNIHLSPDNFEYQTAEADQSDLQMNFLVVENNVLVQDNGTLEAREPLRQILATSDDLTGVAHLWGANLFLGVDNHVNVVNLGTGNYTKVQGYDNTTKFTDISHHGTSLYAFDTYGKMWNDGHDYQALPNPTAAPTVECKGDLAITTKVPPIGGWAEADCFHRIALKYCYTNEVGNTLISPGKSDYYTYGPETWSTLRYLRISGSSGFAVPANRNYGVNIYMAKDENQEYILIGHVRMNQDGTWNYNWMGALIDTASLLSSSLHIPTMNTTAGPSATHMTDHDGRVYFYGSPVYPYRLYIGGNPGNEKSYDRGNGGGFVDIEAGSGRYVTGVEKFKTYNAATILTLTTGSRNSGDVNRYNLLDDTIQVTQEISFRGYGYELVPNTHGTNSYWGHGVWADGMYCLTRYGLSVVTQANEAQNQLRAMYMSTNVDPVWIDQLASAQDNARMCCIEDIIYIIFGDNNGEEGKLDRVIFCYDINLKAWWTYTIDEEQTGGEPILHILPIDYCDMPEGLGIVTTHHVFLLPTSNLASYRKPNYEVLLISGELSSVQPLQATSHVQQLEFRFDYIIGDLDVWLIGVDYFGRKQTVHKRIRVNEIKNNWTEWMMVSMLLESYKIVIKGPARFRLTHIMAKTYPKSSRIGMAWGWDDSNQPTIHHYLRDYNNLRDCLIP